MKPDRFFWIVISLALFSGCQDDFERRAILYSSDIRPVGETVSIVTEIVDLPASTDIVAYGYCWSTSPAPDVQSDTVKFVGAITRGETFDRPLRVLQNGTLYFVRAFLVDGENNVHYGNEISFQNSFFSSFQRTRLNAITRSYYEVLSVIRFNDDETEEHGHVYGTQPGPTFDDDHVAATRQQVGDGLFALTSRLASLARETTYYVRPYLKNRWGVVYGPQITIRVPEELVAGSWEELDFPEAGLFHETILQDGETVYFITGTSGDSSGEFLRESFSINLRTKERRILAEFPGLPVSSHTSFVQNGKIYIVCSDDMNGNSTCTDFWEYDPGTNAWSLRASLDPFLAADVRFAGTFEGSGYLGSMGEDGYLYLSLYLVEYDYWQVVDAIEIPEGLYVGEGTVGKPDGRFIYFFLSRDIFEYDYYEGTKRVIDFPDDVPFDSYPIKMFFYQDDLYVILSTLEIYLLDSDTGEWERRSSLPFLLGGGALFIGTYENKPLVCAYLMDDYLSLYRDDYSLWFQYSE